MVLKGNSKFEILLVKIFSLKQTPNKILTATIEKIKFCVPKKTALFYFRLKLLVLCKRCNEQTRVQVDKELQ